MKTGDDTPFLDRLRSEVSDRVAALGRSPLRSGSLQLDYLGSIGADASILSEWSTGVSLDASPAVPRRRRNHPSLSPHAQWAEIEWDRLEALGKIEFFPGSSRPERLNVSPCALILKEKPGVSAGTVSWKARLIMDLARGQVNDRLPALGVNYGSLDLAASRIRPGDYLYVIDLADAFFNWPVDEHSSWELGFYSPRRAAFGKYNFLPFGLSTSPGLHDRYCKEILRLLAAETGIILTDFVDDFIGRAPSRARAESDMARAVHFFLDCGLPVSCKASGIRAPPQDQLWVGWGFHTVSDTITAPSDKVLRLSTLISSSLQSLRAGLLSAKELSKVAGLASHVAEVLVQGRARLVSAWRALGAAGVYGLWSLNPHANPLIVENSDLEKDFLYWVAALRTPPSRALHPMGGKFSEWGHKSPAFANWPDLAAAGDIRVIETDAAGQGQLAAHATWSGELVAGPWPTHLAQSSINVKELWVAKTAIERFASSVRGWRVLFRIDNSTAVHYVNVRFGASQHLAALAADLELAERAALCWCAAAHIQGTRNVIADLASRQPAFPAAWAGDRFARAMLRKPIFLALEKRLGWEFSVDLFADREGHTALARRWFHPEASGFEASLDGETVWCHPPPSLLTAVFKWVDGHLSTPGHRVKIAILAPLDPKAPWFHPRVLSKYS